MAWSYKPLWRLLVEKEMKKVEMRRLSGISTSARARMGKGETITMDAMGKICQALQCQPGDIVEYIPE